MHWSIPHRINALDSILSGRLGIPIQSEPGYAVDHGTVVLAGDGAVGGEPDYGYYGELRLLSLDAVRRSLSLLLME